MNFAHSEKLAHVGEDTRPSPTSLVLQVLKTSEGDWELVCMCCGGSKLKVAGQIAGIGYEGFSGFELTLIWSPFVCYTTVQTLQNFQTCVYTQHPPHGVQ